MLDSNCNIHVKRPNEKDMIGTDQYQRGKDGNFVYHLLLYLNLNGQMEVIREMKNMTFVQWNINLTQRVLLYK